MQDASISRRQFVAAASVAAGAASVLPVASAMADEASEQAIASPVANYVCATDWLGEPPVIDDADIIETIDADVLIIGAGNAGCNATLAAAQEGVKVVVAEMQTEEDYFIFGDDICAFNSQFMIDRGFGPYDPAELVSEHIRRMGGRVNPAVIKSFAENCGPAFDNMTTVIPETSQWLDYDNQQFTIQYAYGKEDGSYYPIEVGGYKTWAGTYQAWFGTNKEPVHGRMGLNRMTELCYYMLDAATEMGATVLWGHKGIVLDQNENGDVTGAVLEGPDGYVRVNASKGVLISAGDFSRNPEMVFNLLDDVKEWATRVGMTAEEMCGNGRDGSGIKMGCWTGGVIESGPRAAVNAGNMAGPWGTTPTLFINAKGKRFMNECLTPAIAGCAQRQPHGIQSTIVDANFIDIMRLSSIDHGAPDFGVPENITRLEEEMAAIPLEDPAGAEIHDVAVIDIDSTRVVYASETIEGLMKLLGYEGEALENAVASVERYNELCYAGKDEDFGKDAEYMLPIDTPPFYGSPRNHTGKINAGLVTLSGLVTDGNLNVLRADNTTPIKGLYAAGNSLGGRYGAAYVTPLAGLSMGMAYAHGYQAGKVLASL